MAENGLVVCVPARDEAERLPRLLTALALQTVKDFSLVVALNNTSDASREVIAASASAHPHLRIVIDDISFAKNDAHAGHARRRAMEVALDLAGPGGLLLTTDADTRPPPDWLAQNIQAMANGIDIAGGRIVIDDEEPMSTAMMAMRQRADRYWARVRAIEDAIDPVPWDLPPRHGDHTGASLCLTASAYRRAGGVPPVASGEDRALVQAVLRQGGRLAHPFGIWTRVSPRSTGRATGGMAEHMKRLYEDTQANRDVMLPCFVQWRARAEWRRAIRTKGGTALVAEMEDGLPPMTSNMTLTDDALGIAP